MMVEFVNDGVVDAIVLCGIVSFVIMASITMSPLRGFCLGIIS